MCLEGRRSQAVRDGGAHALPPLGKRAWGEPIFARKAVAAAGQNRGAPAILDGRQSPRRHAMAMLISLSQRDEREITVLPPNPFRAFGVNRKPRPSASPAMMLATGAHSAYWGQAGAPWPAPTKRPAMGNGPLAGASQSARGPVHRTGAGRRRRRSARVPAAQREELRTRRSAARKGARDRVRHS